MPFISMIFALAQMEPYAPPAGHTHGTCDSASPITGAPAVQNRISAEMIAEIILSDVYGKQQIMKQRPLIVEEAETTFSVSGSRSGGGVGGVARLILCKSDGKILLISHGK